jgi:hypothetical protein
MVSSHTSISVKHSNITNRVYLRDIIHDLGKGGTNKTGMLHATGEYGFFCDADLSMPISETVKLLCENYYQTKVEILKR